MSTNNGHAELLTTTIPGDAREDRILPLRTAIAAIRNRWWLVLGVLGAVVLVTMWRTTKKAKIYLASTTVRMSEAETPLAGFSQQPYNWRVDPLLSEQQIIKSRPVGERVASQLGLRLTVVAPEDLVRFRSRLFGTEPVAVDTSIRDERFTLKLADRDYSLLQNGQIIATAAYGQPIRAAGLRFTVPSRPVSEGRDVSLRVLPLTVVGTEITSQITTRALPSTDILEISYKGTDPLTVMHVANAIAAAYAEFSARNRQLQESSHTNATRVALDSQQLAVTAAQAAVKAFKEREQISSAQSEQQAIIANIHGLGEKRDQILVEQRVYKNLIGHLSAADSSNEDLQRLAGTDAVNKAGYIATLYQRWHDLVKQREELLTKYKPWYRDVKSVDGLIAQTKTELRNASGLYVQALQSNVDGLEAQIASLRVQLERYPKLEEEETQLLSAEHTAETIFERLAAEYQTARITQATQAGGVRIIDAATQPTVPIEPRTQRILITALVFGLFLGLGAAIAVENLDDSVKSPDEVRERLGMAVLGTIPRIREGATTKRDQDGARLVTHIDPRSPVAEAYRSLRTNLAFARANTAMRTMVLTSPGPADGKSTTVANLAITFAQQGQRTLLIDADLRRAVLDKHFRVPRAPGLTDVLVGQKRLFEVAHATEIANLSVIGSGQFPPNPAELLGSSAMREALREAEEHFDIVLLDSPPLLAVTDAAVLATMVDGAIIVIRVGTTAKTAVRRAIGQLQTVTGRLMGAVLNDVDFRQAAFGGTYGYYYYYYYGQDIRRNSSGAGAFVDRLKRFSFGRSAEGQGSNGKVDKVDKMEPKP